MKGGKKRKAEGTKGKWEREWKGEEGKRGRVEERGEGQDKEGCSEER